MNRMQDWLLMDRRVHSSPSWKWLAMLGCSLIAGCGDASETTVDTPDASDAALGAPVAKAGADQTVQVGTLATLDGRGSQGAQLRFEWTLVSRPSGSKAELSTPREPVVRFLVDLPGPYVARLVVSSNQIMSAPALVMITGVTGTVDGGADSSAKDDAPPPLDAPPQLDTATPGDAGDAARADVAIDMGTGVDTGPDPTADGASDVAIGDGGPRDGADDAITTDHVRDDARDAIVDAPADGSRLDARDADADGAGSDADVTVDAVDVREAGLDGTDANALDAGGDAGAPGCGTAPVATPLGNYKYAGCGTLDFSDVIIGEGGTLYLFSIPLRRIVPWSAVTGVCSNPILLGPSPLYATYSRVNHRIYVGYATGAITAIDPGAPSERPFAHTPLALQGLAAAGGFVLGVDATSPWMTHYVFDAQGNQVASKDWNYWSREYQWSEVNHRMYFFRDDTSPNDVHFEELDCTTGAFLAAGETPYHGSYDIGPPIRVSPDGNSVLIGAGEIYDGHDLHRLSSLPGVIKDAAWLPGGKIVLLREAGTSSLVEQRGGPSLYIENVQMFDGAPLALRSIGDGAVVVTSIGGQPALTVYHENVDGDGDGVPYAQDAFPLDKAASIDTDHDGFPDAWNAGQTGSGSTLTLDAFPLDSACHSSNQGQVGDPTRCDIAGTIPTYTPTAVVFDGTDVLYLHSRPDKRIFRYSTAQNRHLNPFVPLTDTSFVSHVGAHGRLYLAHDDGSISRIDVAGSAEAEFTTVPKQPHGLAGVGNFLLAADPSGAWATHYTFGVDASLISEVEWNYYSREYTFSTATSRVYFFRDNMSPNDIHWEAIDQSTGQISGAGESPYHGDYLIEPPIRVSQDGGYVLLGTGDIYDGIQLNHQVALPVSPLDAAWLPNNGVVVLTSDGVLRWFDNTFTPGTTRAVTGTPLRVFWTTGKLIVVTLVNGRPAFESIAL